MKAGTVYASATEDMDALTFGTPRLLRHLTSPASKKEPVLEITLSEVLSGMELEMDQFIDLCILCGCDYTVNIRGIGAITALKLIKEYKNMEGVLKHLAKDDKHKSRHTRKRTQAQHPAQQQQQPTLSARTLHSLISLCCFLFLFSLSAQGGRRFPSF